MTTWTDDEIGGTVWSDDEPTPETEIGSDQVTFAPSGSGAVSESVQDILRRQWIDVRSFIPTALHAGITAATDTTDLYAYFVNAVAAAVAQKLPLRITAGTYNFDTALSMAGVNIIADGPGLTILKFRGTGTALTITADSVSKSLGTKGFTLLADTGVVGQSGLYIKGSLNGWDGGQIVIRDFDVTGCRIGESGSTAIFFSNMGYIWCHASTRTGVTGFLVDGGVAPNSNANVFHSVYVGGRWNTLFDVRSNGNIFVGGGAEFYNDLAAVTEVFKIAGVGNRFVGTYIEAGSGQSIPDVIWRFASTAVGNSFRDCLLQLALPSGGLQKRIVDLGLHNEVVSPAVGVNFALLGGSNSGINLLKNTQFLGANGSPSISAAPWGWMTFGATAMTRDTGTVRGSSASLKLTSTGTSQSCFQYLYSSTATRSRWNEFPLAYYEGKNVLVGCWVYSATAGCGGIRVTGGTGTHAVGSSAAHSGSSTWEFLTANCRVDASGSTEVSFQCRIETGITGDAYFSEPVFVVGSALPAFTPAPLLSDNADLTGRLAYMQMVAFTDQDTTPDVSLGTLWEAANTVATTITTFDGGIQGQPIYVYFSTGNSRLTNGATLELRNGVSYSPAAGDIMGFVLHGTVWREISRRSVIEKSVGVVSLFDDFLGDVLADQWGTLVGTDPQCVAATIRASQPRGLVRLVTGDDAAASMAVNGTQLEHYLQWQANQGGLVFECRVAIDVVSNAVMFVGFTDQVGTLEMPFTLAAGDALTSNATDAVGILWDPRADTDQWCAVGVSNDADATKQFLGTAPSGATMAIWRVEVSTAGVATFYKDGLKVGTTMSSAVRTTIPLTPVVAAFSVTTASKNIDVDYVMVQANR